MRSKTRLELNFDIDNLTATFSHGERIGDSKRMVRTGLYGMAGEKATELTDTAQAVICARAYWLAYIGLRKAWERSCNPVIWDAMVDIVRGCKASADNAVIYEEEIHELTEMDTFSENDDSEVSAEYAVHAEMVGKKKYDYSLHEDVQKKKMALAEYHAQLEHAQNKRKTVTKKHTYKMVKKVVDTFEEDTHVLYPFVMSDGKTQYVTVAKKIKRNVYKRIRVNIVPWEETKKTLFGKLSEDNNDLYQSVNGMDFVQDTALLLTAMAKVGLIDSPADVWKHAGLVYSNIRRALYKSVNHTSAEDARRLHDAHIRKHGNAPEHITDIADVVISRNIYQIVADILRDRLPARANEDAIVATFWMYFVSQKTQFEIADALHVSQQMIAKYIGYCKKYLATDDVKALLMTA